ncbi:MAG: hypothetical protein J3Q66DRAFT_440327 [Benniella sp.]|nr:MAG: hypothetical protein J3Q66DRAFT_440327 [Benniella sp.]
MDKFQCFRLTGQPKVEKIPYTHVKGYDVIFWDDIQRVYPDVKQVKCEDVTVNLLRDLNHRRIEPDCIKHHPDSILDVVLSSPETSELAQTLPSESKTEQQLFSSRDSDDQVQVPPSSGLLVSPGSQAINDLVHQPNAQLATTLHGLKFDMLEIKNTASLMLKRQDDLDTKQEEMIQLQIQALDRLALIQRDVKALLTQTYELHEYPIPRLFIVLPETSSSGYSVDFFSNKFHLYFLCECGEHTRGTNSKIPHHIHLAKHGGYVIDRPNEFFQQYGSYVLTILRMLKYGITVAGIAVPALTQLIRVDLLDQATESLKLLTKTIEPGVNQVISYFEKKSADDGGAVVEFAQQIGSNEALEGADLRQLETFLKNKDTNRVLGNLYRIVTTEGHVKWVCLDHYRQNYHEKAAKSFRETVDALRGTFDENIGRAEVRLLSRIQAEQFYHALANARSVYELKIELDWETTRSDFKKLRDTLAITNVGVLELDLKHQGGPTRDILNRNQRYDPILDIMRHPSIQSFTIRGPQDLSKRSSLLSRNYDFPNLRHFDISLDQLKDDTPAFKRLIVGSCNLSSLALRPSARPIQVSLGETVSDLVYPTTLRHLDIPLYQLKHDIPGFKRLISDTSTISSLDLRVEAVGSDNGYVLEAYNAITEHRTYPINFKEWDLCLPSPPPKDSDESMAARQCMEHILKFYCETTSAPYLNRNGQKLIWNTVESLRGLSDEDIGRVEATLRSSAQAKYFYSALAKARSVHEFKVVLDWEVTQGDLEMLRDTLATTNVGVLEIDLSCDQLYDAILVILGHQSIRSFTIRGPRDFSKQLNLLSRNEDFSHLQHLDISLHELKKDIPGVMYLIAKASNLSSLAVGTGALRKGDRYVLDAYNAITEHRTYPIIFKDLNLAIPPPPMESNQSIAIQQYMEQLLKFYCENGSWTLDADYQDEMAMDTLAKAIATTNGSGFKKLGLWRYDQLGDSFVSNICSIIDRSELNEITIYMKKDPGRVRIFESIQWKHLRRLDIRMKPGTFETSVMRILVDGVTKMSEKVELDEFLFGGETEDSSLTLPEGNLLRAFVVSVSLKKLVLHIDVTLEQILSLLKSTDFYRLDDLTLWAEGFNSAKVDAIIDGVGHATKLRALRLWRANITEEQKSRMRSKGITLKNYYWP